MAAHNTKVCPYCGDDRLHTTGGKWRCGRCFVEFDQPVTRVMVTQTSAAGETEKKVLSGEGIIVDRYHEATLTGETVEQTVVRYVKPAPATYIPDLAINANYALFLRWLFHKKTNLAQKEHRHGRDSVRRRGYVPVDWIEWRGKTIRAVIPQEEVDDAEAYIAEWLEDFEKNA